MNLIEILQQFQPVRESFAKYAGLGVGTAPLRATCRAAAALFGKPWHYSADRAYALSGSYGNARMLEIALERGAKNHFSLLYWAASGGEREFCKYAMERIAEPGCTEKICSMLSCPLLTGITPRDMMMAGAAHGGRAEFCDWAIQLGSTRYDVMMFYSASSGQQEILARSIALGADIKFMIYGAAHGRRATIMRDAYKLGIADSRIAMDHAMIRKVDYDKQIHRNELMETFRAIHHNDESITRQHLKRFKSPSDECCVELFRLACAFGCECSEVPDNAACVTCFAYEANCREIWQVALDYGKVALQKVITYAAEKGTLDVCEFAFDKMSACGTAQTYIEKILEIGACNGRMNICKFAHDHGAREFSNMFKIASLGGHIDICREAVVWSELSGSRIDVEALLEYGARSGSITLCRAAIKSGAVLTDFALEESISYGYQDIAALIMSMEGEKSRK